MIRTIPYFDVFNPEEAIKHEIKLLHSQNIKIVHWLIREYPVKIAIDQESVSLDRLESLTESGLVAFKVCMRNVDRSNVLRRKINCKEIWYMKAHSSGWKYSDI